MLKTNTKAVKEAVKNYIIASNDETLTELKERFIDEYSWCIKRIGEYNAMIEWLRGLAINCSYTYYDERLLLKSWLQETEEEANKYSDEQVDKLYWHLLATTLLKG